MFGLFVKAPIKELAKEIENQDLSFKDFGLCGIRTWLTIKNVNIFICVDKNISMKPFKSWDYTTIVSVSDGDSCWDNKISLNSFESLYLAKAMFKKYNKIEKEKYNQLKIKEKEDDIAARNKIMSLFKD